MLYKIDLWIQLCQWYLVVALGLGLIYFALAYMAIIHIPELD